MKFSILGFLPLAWSVALPPYATGDAAGDTRKWLYSRQTVLDNILKYTNVTTVLPIQTKTVQVKPLIRSTAKRVKMSYGPYVIPGFDQPKPKGLQFDPSGYTWQQIFDGIPKDATYLSAQIDLTNEDGSRADVATGIYMHHVVTMNLDKREAPMSMCFIPGWEMPKIQGSEFIGAGDDSGPWLFTTGDGSFNSGYYIAPKDRMLWTGEVINYKKEPQSIYVTFEAEYIEGRPQGLLDTQISLWNVQGCGGIGITRPKDKEAFNVTSSKFPIPKDGHIVSIKGHLHDGGINLEAYINDKLVCDSVATYGGEASTGVDVNGEKWETISYMSTCEKLITVKKGDMVQLKAVYDATKHKLRKNTHGHDQEEMGVLTMYFAPAVQ